MSKGKTCRAPRSNSSNCKVTSIGNGAHSRTNHKSDTKKRYRGQGK